MFSRRQQIEIKSGDQLQLMRQAGLVVARTLQQVVGVAAHGVTTGELNEVAHDSLREQGATPSFLGYHGFPAVICTSVNDEVVHGIPGTRILEEGDLLSVDCGAIVDGWHGDAAVSLIVGTGSAAVAELSSVTERALWAGLGMARVGARLSDISHAIEEVVRAAGPFGIVEEYVGHGIGSSMHMSPSIPNFGSPGRGPVLRPGMALAVEPMVTMGSADVGVLSDGWTVVTEDHRWAAHWEHTVAVTEEGPWVLTALDEVRL
ncbi:MAG: type I methionyl aminopeptidase [Actinomycetales bacterium]|nr:type I methionyl aminopeptidase [Actinomycetales bacterium]